MNVGSAARAEYERKGVRATRRSFTQLRPRWKATDAAQYERNRGSGDHFGPWHVPPSALPTEGPATVAGRSFFLKRTPRRGATLRSNRQRRDVGESAAEGKATRPRITEKDPRPRHVARADDRTRVGGGLLRALGRRCSTLVEMVEAPRIDEGDVQVPRSLERTCGQALAGFVFPPLQSRPRRRLRRAESGPWHHRAGERGWVLRRQTWAF